MSGLGLTGHQAEATLREQSAVAAEGSDLTSVICMVGLGDTSDSVDQLVGAFTALCAGHGARPAARTLQPTKREVLTPIQALSPRDAFFSPSRAVPLREAAGRIAAELVVPYPPGIPVLAPGDVIGPEVIDHLLACRRAGAHICGPADPALDTIGIVDA